MAQRPTLHVPRRRQPRRRSRRRRRLRIDVSHPIPRWPNRSRVARGDRPPPRLVVLLGCIVARVSPRGRAPQQPHPSSSARHIVKRRRHHRLTRFRHTAPGPAHHSVGSRKVSSASATPSASHPSRTAARSAAALARRCASPAIPRRTAGRPPPRRARPIISMLSRWVPPITCSRPVSPGRLTRTQIGLSHPYG